VTSASASQPVGLRRGHVAAISAAHCASAFAALGLPPYLPQLLPELGDPQARWAGVLYVLPTLCTALASPVWGGLADRYGPKPLLVRAQLGLALAFGLAAIANSITTLVIALVAQGLLGGTYSASTAYLAAGLQGERLAGALALMQGSARAALAGAPILAGLLSTVLDVRQMYGLAALLPLAAATATLLLAVPAGGAAGEGAGGAAEPGAGEAPRITVGGMCLAEAGFVLATVVTFPYFLPLATLIAPGLPPVAVGLLFAAPHLCYLATAAAALRVLRGRARAGLAAGYALAAASAAVHLVPVLAPGSASLAWLILGRVLLGAALTCGLTSLSQLAAEAAVDRRPGRLFGTVEACSKGGAVLAGASASALAGLGPGAPLLVAVAAGGALAAGVARFTTSGSRVRPSRSERSSL
jgi:MFS family permease